MNFIKKLRISVCVSLIISILFSVFSFAKTSANIREEVLRLHVIANSDSSIDQNLKLRVRDAVLNEGFGIFDGSVNVDNAVRKITPQLDRIKETAIDVIRECGFDYDVNVSVSREYFTTRTYENITLPAGVYLALRIVIGEGSGHNWWCVMFPPMCLPAADKKEEISRVLDTDEVRLVSRNPKYEIRFKVVEIYEKFKNRINEK